MHCFNQMIDLLVTNSSKAFVFIPWVLIRGVPTSVKITAIIHYGAGQFKAFPSAPLVGNLPLCPGMFPARAQTCPHPRVVCFLEQLDLRTRAFLMELKCICWTIGHFWLTCLLFSSRDKKGHAYTICLHW